MSATDAPDDGVEPSQTGGLGELIPEPLMPVWRRIELIQAFRETHGETYVTVLEVLTALVLAAGYAYWAYLYVTGSGAASI